VDLRTRVSASGYGERCRQFKRLSPAAPPDPAAPDVRTVALKPIRCCLKNQTTPPETRRGRNRGLPPRGLLGLTGSPCPPSTESADPAGSQSVTSMPSRRSRESYVRVDPVASKWTRSPPSRCRRGTCRDAEESGSRSPMGRSRSTRKRGQADDGLLRPHQRFRTGALQPIPVLDRRSRSAGQADADRDGVGDRPDRGRPGGMAPACPRRRGPGPMGHHRPAVCRGTRGDGSQSAIPWSWG
jgi:hypothetical protein